jgi:hypothetical protein
MTKKTTRNFWLNANTLRNLLIGYSILASTVALFFIAGFLPMYQNQQRIFAETDFKMMVRDAALGVFDQPQKVANGEKVYLPEVKLAFPVVPGDDGVLYNYEIAQESTPADSTPETVQFASRSAINALVGQDPALFQCQRLATISFSKYDAYGEGPFVYDGSVKLADNREMFIYKNNSSDCARVWADFTATSLVNQLKKAETYQAN